MSEELTSRRINSTFNMLSVRVVHSYHIDTMLMLLEEKLPPTAEEVLRIEVNGVRDALVGHFDTACPPASFDELVRLLVGESSKGNSIGFLLKAEQPYFVHTGTGQLSYTWDTPRSSWFYGQTYQDALFRVYRWALRNKEDARTSR